MPLESARGPFKICGSCRCAWPTWDSFVLDPGVRLIGLQAVAVNSDFNALIFEHRCGSSISVLTPRLRHLLPEEERNAPSEVLMGSEQCRGHCRLLADLEMCDAPCGNARDRRLILLVGRMKTAQNPRSAE